MTQTDSRYLPRLPFQLPEGVMLVDFYASWCIPCRNFEPTLQELEQIYRGRASVARIDIDENRKVAMALGIQSIPTIIIFKDGHERKRLLGLQTLSSLVAAIDLVLEAGLDKAGPKKG